LRKVAVLVLLLRTLYAGAQDVSQNELKKLSLEELMDLNVTSVARTADPLARTAAAVTVITAEDIRRSGATNIPEILRLVPGMDVARFGSGSWAISARGFNSTAADKMLVLIDGRTVYSPLFSGTFWEVQDLLLDEIERIEVIRGPGGTLWGANAVNGVISIITKTAHQTKGTLTKLWGGGAEDLGGLGSRFGSSFGSDVSYRVDGKYSYRDQLKLANGGDAKDSTRLGLIGFRADVAKSNDDFTLEGSFYNGLEGNLGRQNSKFLGGSLLGRSVHRFSSKSELQLQTYFERDYRRVNLQSEFVQRIFDIDLQHHFRINEQHQLAWGAEYRWNSDETQPTIVLSFLPQERTYPLETAFVQDEISLARDRVRLTIGTKVEHNDFTGFEAQPSARANWLVRPDHAVWAAFTRAVRTPTRFDTDIRFGPPGFAFFGNPDFKSEELFAYEIGYRGRPARKLSLDLAAFINKFDRIRSLEFEPPGRILETNHTNAKTAGGEVAANYDLTSWLRLRGNYSLLSKHLDFDPGHSDLFGGTLEGNDPHHQFVVQALTDIRKHFEWDLTGRFVSSLPAPPVPRYFEMDTRFGWNPKPSLELSVVGRNLLDKQHPEFGPPGPLRGEVKRNIYGRIALKF
jgi:iron complex outermembrane recepter protein